MLTLNKLRIFKQYAGDLDALRHANSADKDAITSHDWFVIGNLLQDIRLVNRSLASEAYAGRVEEALEGACDNQATIDELRKMAE
ncbi:hypothetical protein [Chitinophaga sp. YIM B06452]|uniref:hypothetical protein n=1 Tax=Chitinophaga sp. YIM B06452 TaxID=3082158 RepID=UPI0031FEF240